MKQKPEKKKRRPGGGRKKLPFEQKSSNVPLTLSNELIAKLSGLPVDWELMNGFEKPLETTEWLQIRDAASEVIKKMCENLKEI